MDIGMLMFWFIFSLFGLVAYSEEILGEKQK